MIDLYAYNVFSAVFFQVKFKLFLYPFLESSSLKSLLFNNFTSASASSFSSYGFINIAEPHVTSGIDVTFEVITGALQLIASSGGRPKPS